mmetsp:Transcript_8064/g.15108  ORF Transcript_8064/g.15108 Transcript_8064/m.15108 type:complete len:554 (-) Transcript_8064:47-1708(-)
MGRVDIPLYDRDQEEKKVELPQCAWCGSKSKTICGRCKSRAYCSVDCQKLDWKSGHQTACSVAPVREPEEKEREFEFYQVPYVAHWAINVRKWPMKRDSREFNFLLERIPEEEIRESIKGKKTWKATKLALVRELVVRRMSEILTQGVWHKTTWKHDPRTGRDYLLERTEYIWTGKKYINSDKRFPNFNFSMTLCGDYLFVVSHPVALTGVFAGGRLESDVLPDPREEYAGPWKEALEEAAAIQAAAAAAAEEEGGDSEEAADQTPVPAIESSAAAAAPAPAKSEEADEEVIIEEVVDESSQAEPTAVEVPAEEEITEAPPPQEKKIIEVPVQKRKAEKASAIVDVPDGQRFEEAAAAAEEEDADAESKSKGKCLLHSYELIKVCEPENLAQRQLRLRLALVGKTAYYRTLGETRHRQWRDVILEQEPVGIETAGGELSKDEKASRPGGPRRHHLYVMGKRQNTWRCEVHNFKGHCVVVCRGPVDEAVDPDGHFTEVHHATHLDIDVYDKVLEHTEPTFIEVPIKQLLPEKNHSDYVRATGKGEKGEQVRMNR